MRILFISVTIYIIVLLASIIRFLFFKREYKNQTFKNTFHEKSSDEALKKNKKFNEKYQKNQQKKIIKLQRVEHKRQKNILIYQENPEIIDIVKPVGRWTKIVILDGMMKRLSELINKKGNKEGFWEFFIKAQTSTKGKHKGRYR